MSGRLDRRGVGVREREKEGVSSIYLEELCRYISRLHARGAGERKTCAGAFSANEACGELAIV